MTVAGSGPAGAATFAYVLDSGLQVTYSWTTDVFKSESGVERRASLLSAPRQAFHGNALIDGPTVRSYRNLLARYGAAGSSFRVGMPWEELTLADDASGAVVYVDDGAHAASDWATIEGQRVIIVANDGTSITAVIQSTTPGEITLDVSPGDIGARGGKIMPTAGIYLDPTQGFARYGRGSATSVEQPERWQLNARAIEFGFSTTPTQPFLALVGVAMSGVLDGVVLSLTDLVTDIYGTETDDITIEFTDDGPGVGTLIEELDLATVHVKFDPDVTTIDDLVLLLSTSTMVTMSGTYTGSDTLASSDAFSPTAVGGGVNREFGEVGVGAELTMYADRPVFDRGVDLEGTVSDSVQLMTETIDLGGTLASASDVTSPEWGRQISITRTDLGEWQWLKKFLDAIRGKWKAFWLSSSRQDMVFVSKEDNVLTVSGGDISAWHPERDRIQITYADGSVTYAQIEEFDEDEEAGTAELTLSTDVLSDDVAMISWLELCRLESDDITVAFNGAGFSMKTSARVISQVVPDDIEEEDDMCCALFGDGSDGALSFDGSTAVLGITPSSSIYTLDKNVHATTISFGNGVEVKTNGFMMMSTGLASVPGGAAAKVTSNGNAGSGTTGGASRAAGYLPASVAGGNGGASSYGLPTNGANSGRAPGTDSALFKGGDGGSSGFGSPGDGGHSVGGTITLAGSSADVHEAFSAMHPLLAFTNGFTAGSGGGGGRGGFSGAGGAGGASGGYNAIAFRTWSGNLTLEAKGGAGANGATGHDGGGGGGGGGGVVAFATESLTAPTISVAGGAPGTGGGTPAGQGGDNDGGKTGATGADGLIVTFLGV